VKNCGAWGSMAPPSTVDIIFLFSSPNETLVGLAKARYSISPRAQNPRRQAYAVCARLIVCAVQTNTRASLP